MEAELTAESAASPMGDLLPGCDLTEVALTVREGALSTEEEWRAALTRLAPVAIGGPWWLGDLLAFGEARYGEKYATAAAETGLSVQTLKNRAWVSRRVAYRLPGVPWGCHRLVASIKDENEQRAWLDLAAAEGWSAPELSREMRRPTESDDGDEFPGGDGDTHDFCCPNCRHEWSGDPRP